jgi:hypothetical protein
MFEFSPREGENCPVISSRETRCDLSPGFNQDPPPAGEPAPVNAGFHAPAGAPAAYRVRDGSSARASAMSDAFQYFRPRPPESRTATRPSASMTKTARRVPSTGALTP